MNDSFDPETRLPFRGRLPKINLAKLKLKREEDASPCGFELQMALSCFTGNDAQDRVNCAKAERDLRRCIDTAVVMSKSRPQHKNSLTFDIHRIARKLGYRF